MEITPAAEAASSAKPFTFSVADTTRVAKKLTWSTGKAAWTFGTSFLLLVVPLIIQLHREEQMMALEQEQLGVLNSGAGAPAAGRDRRGRAGHTGEGRRVPEGDERGGGVVAARARVRGVDIVDDGATAA